MDRYCRRLIEVDFPIKQISKFARDEKNLRNNHPWHLHLWWARRPWGACRAITLAGLLPAPTDEMCSDEFVAKANEILSSVISVKNKTRESLQAALVQFVGVFSAWEMGKQNVYLDVARKLILLASREHRPLVLDSFAGYGAIPGEAARLGCESVAGELNPVALICLKTMLEYIPKHGHGLLDVVAEGATFVQKEARKRLLKYYPMQNGKDPIAWLWARTIRCEGPSCGAIIPMISQVVIAKGRKKTWIEITGDAITKKIEVHIRHGSSIPTGLTKTVSGSHAICPVCNFTTNKLNVKIQANNKQMGQRIFGKAMAVGQRQGKLYFDASEEDVEAFNSAARRWAKLCDEGKAKEINEKYPFHDSRAFTAGLYGLKTWGDLFSARQKLALHTIGEIVNDYAIVLQKKGVSNDFIRDVVSTLALPVSNTILYNTVLSGWIKEGMQSCSSMNAILMRWDYAEANPLVSHYAGGLEYSFRQSLLAMESCAHISNPTSSVFKLDATALPLPDDSADIFFTDPPYYDTIPYADLSDMFYVWLKRFIGKYHPDLFAKSLTPKEQQLVVNPYATRDGRGDQSPERYKRLMTLAFNEGRRVLKPDGIGTIVFAHKGTEAWETLLSSIIDAGFIVTASWPIDTERAARMRANKSAALGSSVHIVVRPRENPDGTLRCDAVGNWSDVLIELPRKIHEWMPRLAEEGVVGADAIFACLGPALEIYSRYSSVEKASGEKIELKEYLQEIWAAVSREALNMIFEGADASGFEEDARLTAMWLWTLHTAVNGNGGDSEDEENEENGIAATKNLPGYGLEYDAARKIAQGLGVNLEDLSNLVDIKGDTATLLSASARTRYLFGKEAQDPTYGKIKKKSLQMSLDFEGELAQVEAESGNLAVEIKGKAGKTVLDQLHQSMILFGSGRGEAMKRLLVEEGVGRNPHFWRLAQALSALYPAGTDEKRWVDGVLARKKGLGL